MNDPSAPDLADWLTERVAFYLDRPTTGIEAHIDLAAYGMDSLYALSLASDVEDRFDVVIEAADLRDHPTINALADRLRQLLAERPVHSQSGRTA